MADPNRRVIVQEIGAAEHEVDRGQSDTGGEKQSARGPARRESPGHGMTAENVVDNDLERPGLKELQAGDEEDLEHGEQELPTMRPQKRDCPPSDRDHVA